MLEWLLALDREVLLLINRSLANPVFDALMPWFREKLFWAPLYIFLLAFLFEYYGKKAWWLVMGLVITVGLADFFSSELVKKNVRRLRPCNDITLAADLQPRVRCGSGFSFTSSHATNHFAVAVYLSFFLGRLHRRVRPALLLWAASIAYAQVYVGVHYPGDVLAGALLGAWIGWFVARRIARLEVLLRGGSKTSSQQ